MSFSKWKRVFTKQIIGSEKKSLISGPFGSNIGRKFFVEKGIPVIRGNNLSLDKSVRFIDKGFVFVTEEKAKELGAWAIKDDIIFTAAGTIGQVGILKDASFKKYIISNKQIRLRLNTDIVEPLFAYYWYSSDVIVREIINNNTGSTIPLINLGTIKLLPIFLPPLSEQKAIADTLSCLDDKIEINNRINKTLEEMAQGIFKSWFVDFDPFQDGEFEDSELGSIPKGWRVGKLGDIANITMGQSPKGTSYNEESNGAVFYQGRTDFGRRYPTIRLYTTEPKRMSDKGDILLSVRAPVGDINVASEDCCIGRGLASLKSKESCNSYLLYQLLNLKDSFNVYNGEGTVFGSINKDTLNNLRILIPSNKNILEFQDSVGKLDEIFENNSIQSKILTSIRDSLLPKLMSGEVRVPIEEV